jgi:hypothetical protein
MDLRNVIKEFITNSGISPPKTKTLECCVDLFVIGARAAKWNQQTAKRWTDKFKEKTKGRNHHYIWALESLSLKFCPSCYKVKSVKEFHSNISRKDNTASGCIGCFLLDQKNRPERWRAYASLRKANKLNATPPWANLNLITEFYLNCPDGYQVDHIIPLNNSIVCGLHTVENLQYLTKEENLKKSNKFMDG